MWISDFHPDDQLEEFAREVLFAEEAWKATKSKTDRDQRDLTRLEFAIFLNRHRGLDEYQMRDGTVLRPIDEGGVTAWCKKNRMHEAKTWLVSKGHDARTDRKYLAGLIRSGVTLPEGLFEKKSTIEIRIIHPVTAPNRGVGCSSAR